MEAIFTAAFVDELEKLSAPVKTQGPVGRFANRAWGTLTGARHQRSQEASFKSAKKWHKDPKNRTKDGGYGSYADTTRAKGHQGLMSEEKRNKWLTRGAVGAGALGAGALMLRGATKE